LRVDYQDGPKVRNNSLDFSTTTYTGSVWRIYLLNADNDFEVTGNRMVGDRYGYGIYFSSCDGAPSNRGLVANNFVNVGNPATTSTSYGIYLTNSGNLDLVHNSVHMRSNGTNSRALYGTTGGSVDCYNNIFVNDGPGFAVYANSAYTFANFDHNCVYAPNSNSIGYYGGNQATFADWQNVSGYDANSWNIDPQFYGLEDLHICNDTLDGAGKDLVGVPMDIDGDMRNTAMPDIGADEFTPVSAFTLGPDMDICTGDTLQIMGGTATDSVMWSTGATTPMLEVTMPGTYSVTISNACGMASDTIVVSQSALTYSGFLAADTMTACTGDSIRLYSTQMGDTYTWSNGGTNFETFVTTAGTYDLTLSDNCGTGMESVSVNFIDAPTASATVITTFLTASWTNGSTNGGGNATYSWDFGDGNMSNQTDPVHVYASSGTYNVTLIVTNECGSDTFVTSVTVGTTSIEDELGQNVTLTPNPNAGQFTLGVQFEFIGDMDIIVSNIYGQVVWERSESFDGSYDKAIDLSDLASGTYYVKIRMDDTQTIKRMVKQ
ncbi:MAG: PKD domain-containing protein, partial [Bacteroidota bacterium]